MSGLVRSVQYLSSVLFSTIDLHFMFTMVRRLGICFCLVLFYLRLVPLVMRLPGVDQGYSLVWVSENLAD